MEDTLTLEHEILMVDLKRSLMRHVSDKIVIEKQIELYVNGKTYAVFLCLESQIKELAVGHLLTEGSIDGIHEIESVTLSKNKVYVHLTRELDLSIEKPEIIPTMCSGAGKVLPRVWMKRSKEAHRIKVDPRTIIEAITKLNSKAHVFKKTGATHSSALFDEKGGLLAFSEDIGRHNTVDKVVGEAAFKGVDFKKTFLASTGRLTSEMVVKAANVGIPVIVSISAPTDRGIKIAKLAGLTLVGFARGKRFNVYTHPERILKVPSQTGDGMPLRLKTFRCLLKDSR